MMEWFAMAKIKGFLAGLLKSPYFWAALLVVGIGAGTYFYLKHSTNQQIEAAVENSQSEATIDAFKTQDGISFGEQEIDQKYDQKKQKTTEEFNHVRNIIQAAPVEQRQAPVPPLLIDTLNNIDRMHAGGPVPVPDTEVPVG